MAAVTGMAFSLSDALADAAKLDNKFNKWVDQAIEIETHMKKAFLAPSSDGIAKDLLANLATLKAAIDGMKGETISPKVNTEELDELTKAIDIVNSRINGLVDIAAKEGVSLELFNVNALNASGEGVLSLQSKLESLLEKMQDVEEQWKDNLEAFEEAKGRGDTMQMAAATLNILDLEKEYNLLTEQKKKVEADLAWAKKSVSEQNEIIAKKQKKVQAEENEEVQRITKSYISLNQELRELVNSRDAIEKASEGKTMTAMEQEVYNSVVVREAQVRDEILKLETEHLEHISELRIRYAAKDAKNIVEEIKKRQYSSSEALALASAARTGTQMEYAKDAVKTALMTVDKDDTATIEALNKAYIDLRANIEKLTKAQNNEKTLQPTLRNEYERILKEIDKVAEAKQKLAETEVYKNKDAQALADYDALEAREADLAKRKIEIRDGNEALLTEIETKHEAERAQARIKEYERAQKEIEELEKKYGKISVADAQKVKTDSEDVENVRQAKQAIEDLKEARDKLDKEDSQYAETVDELNEKIKEHEEYIESVTNAEKHREKQAKKARETYKGAMDYSKQAKSINEMKEAMRALEVARDKEEVGTKQYKELDRELARVTKRYKELTDTAKKTSRGLWNIGDQLARKFALWFSVSQIQGYIHKLMEVRGEFELQQRSLQAILQDKEAADKVWQKTIDLAVQSPFRIKDLVKYTKQLAAYRIESDKLFETNKMLADVSAGLGVDMDRLILAYGQVRSAAYLRGTELRQFTEAGIPMLEELANLLEETEDRSVSTAEVFEMISKRMIGFSEVEEVFRRMTSAGGVFYQMQEKQADTLKGQMSNLKDSIDVMLNDIGVSMEGVLKSSVETVKNLVESWKDFVDVLNTFPVKALLASFAAIKLAGSGLGKWLYDFVGKIPLLSDGLLGLEISVESLTKKSKLLGGAWGGVLKLLGGAATAGIAVGFAFLIKKIAEAYLKTTELSRATERLNKAWGRIFTEDVDGLQKSIEGYSDLVTRLSETNEKSQERRQIISRLNNEYGEYLDFVVDENTQVSQLTDSYDALVKRMKEKASLTTYEKGVQAIEEEYVTSLANAKEDFYKMFKGMSIRSTEKAWAGIIPTTEDIDNIYSLIQQRIQELSADQLDTLSEQDRLIQEIVKGYYGDEFYLSRDYAHAIELMNVLAKKKEKEEELQKEINARYSETLKSREAILKYQKLENEYKAKQAEIRDTEGLTNFEVNKRLEALKEQFELNKIEIQVEFGSISEKEGEERKDKLINWATDTTRSVNEAIKANLSDAFEEEELARVLITREDQEKGMAAIIKDITDGWEQQNKTIAEQISLKSEGLEINEKLLEKALRMEKLYRNVAEIIGVELKYTQRLSEESRNAINALLPEEYQISLEQAYGGIDAILTNLKAKETEHLNVIEQLNEQKKNGLPIDEEALQMAEEAYWWTKKKQDLLDPKAKTSISQERVDEVNAKLKSKYQIDSIDKTKDEVTLLSEANTEKQKAIAYEEQLIAMKNIGLSVTEEELAKAKEEVEQWKLRWQLLGGTEEEKTRKTSEQLTDERIKVVEDMNRAYKELNQTLSKSESLEGAFAKYKDAFKKAYAGTSLLPKNFGKMTAEQFIKEFNFTTEEGMVGFFDKLIKYAKKTSEKVDVELAKGDYIMETKVQLKKDSDKEILKQVQELFDQYDLSLELKSLYIPKELASQLGVDYLNLDELKKAVEARASDFIGTDMEDEYKDFLDKIDDMEKKASVERMKTYSKYLIEGMNERVKLKIEELRKLKELEENSDFNKAQKARIKDNISQEARVERQKLDWKDFQGSEMYTMMFEDIENLGTQALETLKAKLEELKGSLRDLPADEVKEIIGQITKIEDITIKRNPFTSLRVAMAEVRELEAKGRTEEALQDEFAKAEVQRMAYQEELDAINLILNAEGDKNLLMQQSEEWQKKYYQYLTMQTDELEDQRLVYSSLVAGQGFISSNAAKDLKAYAKARKALSSVSDEWDTIRSLAGTAWDSAKEILESMGVESDSLAMTIGDATMNLLDLVAQGVMFYFQLQLMTAQAQLLGVAMNTALGPIGWVVLALQAVATILTAIFSAKDKALQKQVEENLAVVEGLQKKYDKLEEAIEDAWSTASIQQYNKELIATTKSMIAFKQAAIAAQEQRKGANKEGSDVNKELQDMREELKELEYQLEDSLAESFSKVTDGILDSVHDAAKDFTDAWYEAYKETGDGLKGLEDNFEEMFLSLAKNQAAMQITGAFAEQWKKDLEKYININDTELTKDEARAWAESVRKTFPELNDALEAYFGAIGDVIGMGDAQGLSALQKGIQGVTEETAQVIESLLNSMRYYQADSNSQLHEQTRYLRDIYTLLNSMTTTSSSLSGRGFKAIIG